MAHSRADASNATVEEVSALHQWSGVCCTRYCQSTYCSPSCPSVACIVNAASATTALAYATTLCYLPTCPLCDIQYEPSV
eukprot:1351297-Rhodomonas_salina.2